MNYLVFFALVAVASPMPQDFFSQNVLPQNAPHDFLPQNFLPQDTPEVVAAKNAHFTEFARAAARVGVFNPPSPNTNTAFFSQTPTRHGFQADTPEVAEERARHLAEHARLSGVPVSSGSRTFPTYRELFPKV